MAIGRTNAVSGGGSGGSGGLNFQVIGGTTAPSNPKENTIWVNTSTKITDWVFSATQPSAKSGRVWIFTDTSSPIEFNALKENGIQVYPISAKQYVSDAWVDKVAKISQGGAWVDWIKYIIQNGVSELFTGNLRSGYGSLTKGNGYIKINSYDNYTCGGATSKKIDITTFSELTMRCNVIGPATYIGLGIATAINNSGEAEVNSSIVAQTKTTKTGEQTITVNISKYTGGYYPCVKVDCGAASGDGEVHVYDMYLS